MAVGGRRGLARRLNHEWERIDTKWDGHPAKVSEQSLASLRVDSWFSTVRMPAFPAFPPIQPENVNLASSGAASLRGGIALELVLINGVKFV